MLTTQLLFLKKVAVWTGLEPATPCVTGRYSNQLNYQTVALIASLIAKQVQIYIRFLICQKEIEHFYRNLLLRTM